MNVMNNVEESTSLVGARVMVTGGGGFLGRRIVAELKEQGAEPVPVRSRDYDLRRPEEVRRAIAELDCSRIIHAAAVVGGIGANRKHPGRFFYENAVMGIHLVHEAYDAGVERLLVVGTACSYPKFIPTPFKEESLWDGYPEETNAPYGLAKKMILAQGQAYRAEYGFNFLYVIPTNLYGPGDNFDLESSHVIPAIIRKFVEAKEAGTREVVLWGTGEPSREFLFVDDAARGVVAALTGLSTSEPINLGVSQEVKIKDLVALIRDATGYEGEILWDSNYPDGQPRRAVDGSKASRLLGWKPQVTLEEGLKHTVHWYLEQRHSVTA